MKEFRILLIGGGSGGHAYPLVAVAQALKKESAKRNIELKLMMLGSGAFLKRAAEENNIPYKIITAGKLRRYLSIESLVDVLKAPVSFMQSLWHVFWFMPDAVFSKGGYDSLPPALVARLFFIPVFIHESDSVPGLANVIISKIARKVFLSFRTAEGYFKSSKIIFTGNPTRPSLASGDKSLARQHFNLKEPRPTILVLGGSQGAKLINEVIISSLVVMAQKFNIIHQCGDSQYQYVKKDLEMIKEEGNKDYVSLVEKYYRPYSFFDEKQLSLAFALSDVVVSRAGAAFLFEIAQAGKPAIIIPISKSPANHQYLNAFEFSLSGGYLMEEPNLNRESLIRELESLLIFENYVKVSDKIKTFATPDAADMIASEIFKYLKI